MARFRLFSVMVCWAAAAEGAVPGTVLAVRSGESSQAPMKTGQIAGVAVGCLVYIVLWVLGMKWLLVWNEKKRKEISSLKEDIEKKHPGLLAGSGISLPTRPTPNMGFFREICRPCLKRRRSTESLLEKGPVSPDPVAEDKESKIKAPAKVSEPSTKPVEIEREPSLTATKGAPSVPPGTTPSPREHSPTTSTQQQSLTAKVEVPVTPGRDGQPTDLRGHVDDVWALAFSHDSRLLATGFKDGTVQLWETETWKNVDTKKIGSGIRSLAFFPDSEAVTIASSDGFLSTWDVKNDGSMKTIQHDGIKLARCVSLSPDSRTLTLGMVNGTINVFKVSTDGKLRIEKLDNCAIYDSEEVNPATVFIRDKTSTAAVDRWSHWSVALGADSKILASAPPNSANVELFTFTEQVGRLETGEEDGAISCIAFSHDGKMLVAVSEHGAVRGWEVQSDDPLGRLIVPATKDRKNWASAIALSHDSRLVALGSADGRIWVHEVRRHSES